MGILLAIHVLVTIFLILIVLIQKNEGGSSLFANSGGNGMFNARGTSNILTKTTWGLASVFLINCIAMATIDSSHIRNAQSIIEKKEQPQQTSKQDEPAEGQDEEDDANEQGSNASNPDQEKSSKTQKSGNQ